MIYCVFDILNKFYQSFLSIKSEVACEISTTIPTEFSSTLNVIYFPQLGYLITVPLKPEWKNEDDFKIDGLYYQVKIYQLFINTI
jgi:DNA mismatch repair protein MSH5